MPAFILLINKTNFSKLGATFAREVVENDVGKELNDRTNNIDQGVKELKEEDPLPLPEDIKNNITM